MRNIDIKKIRLETPGCNKVLHFNNAGAALSPEPVFQAVIDHLALERDRGGYEAAYLAQRLLQEFYGNLADLLNCAPKEIAYVENATRAWDMAFYAIPFKKGDKILTSQAEYASNYLAFLQMVQRHGVKINIIPNDEYGQLSVKALERLVDKDVKLIAITHVPTHGGLINPAREVGVIAGEYKILYLLDACQSVGQMPLDVQKIGCDILSGTGRKYLRGPRGTGFLYMNKSLIKKLKPPFVDLHSATWTEKDKFELREDAKRFENWESYIAGRIGLATAVRYALNIGLPVIWERIRYLADLLRKALADLPGITIQDLGQNKCGLVTFTKKNETASQIKKRLFAEGINVSVSPVRYARLDLEPRGLKEIVRASVHYYNTEDEIKRFCKALMK